jgi:hypothetical protein
MEKIIGMQQVHQVLSSSDPWLYLENQGCPKDPMRLSDIARVKIGLFCHIL